MQGVQGRALGNIEFCTVFTILHIVCLEQAQHIGRMRERGSRRRKRKKSKRRKEREELAVNQPSHPYTTVRKYCTQEYFPRPKFSWRLLRLDYNNSMLSVVYTSIIRTWVNFS